MDGGSEHSDVSGYSLRTAQGHRPCRGGYKWVCADAVTLLLLRSSYPIPKGMGLMYAIDTSHIVGIRLLHGWLQYLIPNGM